MRKLCAGILVMTLAGCATTREGRPSGQDAARKEGCTRFEAATRSYFNAMNPIKFQERAITDCRSGNPMACVSVPFAIPYTTVLVVGLAPIIIPLGLTTDNPFRDGCPQQPDQTSDGATTPDVPPSGAEPPDEAPD